MATEVETYTDEYDLEEQYDLPQHISMRSATLGLMALALLYFLIAVGFALNALRTELGLPAVTASLVSLVLLVMSVVYILVRWMAGGRLEPFALDNVFLLSFFAYNLGIWMLYLFGSIPLEAFREMPYPDFTARSLMLCGAALPAFLAGYLARQIRPVRMASSANLLRSAAAAPILGHLGFGLFVLAVMARFIFIFLIVGAGTFFGRRYITTDLAQVSGSHLYFISEVFSRIAVVTMAVGYAWARGKLAPALFWPIYGAFLLLLLVDGERGVVFATLLSLVIVRHRFIKPFKWKTLLIGATALLFLFAAVRVARMMPERSLSGLMQALSGQSEGLSFRDMMAETGGSFVTINRTVHRVPSMEGHKYGATLLPGAVSVIPGAYGLSLRATGGFAASYLMTPASWLTYREAGLKTVTSGLGFSNVAESYLNFGAIGVPVVFFMVGSWVRGTEIKSYANPSLMRVAMFVATTDVLFYWSRASLDAWFRPLVWTAIMVGIAYKIGSRRLAVEPEYQPEQAAAY